MAKFKIQKGLSDADMMKNFKDTENFEDTMLDMERSAKKPVVHQSTKQKEDAFYYGVCTGSASAFSENLATREEVDTLLRNIKNRA